MKKLSILFALLSIVFCLTACGGGGGGGSDTRGGGSPTVGEDRVLASVAISGGNSQTAMVGTELSEPLVAQLHNQAGSPIAGLVVNFRVVTGGGAFLQGLRYPITTASSESVGPSEPLLVRRRSKLGQLIRAVQPWCLPRSMQPLWLTRPKA